MSSKLTAAAIFLVLYISQAATSALPSEPMAQPGEARNIMINDPRVPPVYDPHQCEDHTTWFRRQCTGPQTWQDVCARVVNFRVVFENKPGSCEDYYTCFDIIDANGDRFIDCRPNEKSTGKRKIDPQTGTSEEKRARTQLANTQMEHSVTIDHDMKGASVTAVLKSECPNVHCRMSLAHVQF